MKLCVLPWLFALLFSFCLAGCTQERLDNIRVSGDMTTQIGIHHGVHGSNRVRTGIDF